MQEVSVGVVGCDARLSGAKRISSFQHPFIVHSYCTAELYRILQDLLERADRERR